MTENNTVQIYPRIMWMKTIQQDLKSTNFCVNETTDMAQNHPL